MGQRSTRSVWNRDLITGQEVPPTPHKLSLVLEGIRFGACLTMGVVLLAAGAWSTPFRWMVLISFAGAAGSLLGLLFRRAFRGR